MPFWLSYFRRIHTGFGSRFFWSWSDQHEAGDRVGAASESPDLRWVWSSHGTSHTHTHLSISLRESQYYNNIVKVDQWKRVRVSPVRVRIDHVTDDCRHKESNSKNVHIERLIGWTCIKLENKKIMESREMQRKTSETQTYRWSDHERKFIGWVGDFKKWRFHKYYDEHVSL